MDFRNVEQPEKLVLGGVFIICQMSRAQDKPPLLPCLLIARVNDECGTGVIETQVANTPFSCCPSSKGNQSGGLADSGQL